MQTLNREEFLHRLESVLPGIAPNNAVEHSSSFIFLNGRINAFNEEVCCRSPSGLPKEVVGAVEHKQLLELLRLMEEDEVQVSVSDSKLVVKGKRRQAKLNLDANIETILSYVKGVEKPEAWSQLPPDFCEAVSIVHHCCKEDRTNLWINCVHVHPRWVEARDDSQLCRWPMETGVAEAAQVRASSIKHVSALGMTEMAETAGWLHFRNPSKLVLSCRRYVEEYPDNAKHLKVGGEAVSFPKGMVKELERANVLSAESDSDRVMVELAKGKVRITGTGVHGEYTAWPKLKYDGAPMRFLAAPKMLAEIVQEHNECFVSAERIKVEGKGKKYCFVACLSPVEESNEAEPEAAEE